MSLLYRVVFGRRGGQISSAGARAPASRCGTVGRPTESLRQQMSALQGRVEADPSPPWNNRNPNPRAPPGRFRRRARGACCRAASGSIRRAPCALHLSRGRPPAEPIWGAPRRRRGRGRGTRRSRRAGAGTLPRRRASARAACACASRSRTCSSRCPSRPGLASEAAAGADQWPGSPGTTRIRSIRRSPGTARPERWLSPGLAGRRWCAQG